MNSCVLIRSLTYTTALLYGLLYHNAAQAFCGHYLGTAESTISNSVSHIVYVREGNKSTITMANDFQGGLPSFSMLIPVPGNHSAPPKQVSMDLLSRVNQYAGPRLVEYNCADLYDKDNASGGCTCGSSIVDLLGGVLRDELVDLFEMTELAQGEYQITDVPSQGKEELENWVADQGLYLPAEAADLIEQQLTGGTQFYALQVGRDEIVAGNLLLPPIQFSYESSVWSLPIQLGALNSLGAQEVILHVITDIDDGAVAISNYPEFSVESECMVDESVTGFSAFYEDFYLQAFDDNNNQASWSTEYVWAPLKCDPCTGSGPLNESLMRELGYEGDVSRAVLSRLHIRYAPSAIHGDLSLYPSQQSTNHQQKYIVYQPSLESDFPICGQGFVESGGSCEQPDTASQQSKTGNKTTTSRWAMLLGLSLLGLGRRFRIHTAAANR